MSRGALHPIARSRNWVIVDSMDDFLMFHMLSVELEHVFAYDFHAAQHCTTYVLVTQVDNFEVDAIFLW